MTAFALTLILIAAVLHASWNLCAKRVGGGLPWVWLVGAIICAFYLPVVAVYWLWKHPELPWDAIVWIFGSGVLKTAYSLFLQRGYRHGDFSLIYPLARGTGPLLSTLAAVAILGERPSALALAGALAIIAAVFWVAGGWERIAALISKRPQLAAAPAGTPSPIVTSFNYGLLSGVFIASYTLWDKHGVAGLAIAPLLYDAGTSCTQLVLLTPFVLRRWPEVAQHWREHWHYAFAMAVLAPAAYVLVLTAMTFTPVSYVAPAREVSIVIGAFFGAHFLKESDSRKRIIAAAVMAAGVVALALG